MRQTILLTGADGQLGHELARSLSPLGDVRAFNRRILDLSDATQLRECVRAVRPSLIVNAAAYTAVDAAESNVGSAESVNAVAPGLLAEEAGDIGAAIVHVSTDYVFDGTSQRAYVESDSPRPTSVYGASKLDGERAVANAGAPYLIFRTSWVYGLRGKNFLRTMRRLFAEREEISVVEDQLGGPTWSRCLAEGITCVVASLSHGPDSFVDAMHARSGTYHLSAPDHTSWHGFATAILELDPNRVSHKAQSIRAISTKDYPTAASRPANSRLDVTLAERTFGVRLPEWREQLMLCLADAC